MIWADYELIYDTPDKGFRNRADVSELIVTPLAESLATVEHELVVISPYFVPTRELRDGLIRAAEKGLDVTVITNSLAANNQKTVHGGYAPARKPLLRAGVRLIELRPDAVVSGTEFVDASEARSTLHTKAYIVDRREVFIGSFNFDPRSMYINTEMGVIIKDPGWVLIRFRGSKRRSPKRCGRFSSRRTTDLPGLAWRTVACKRNRRSQ